MVWNGMVWYGRVWYGMVRYDCNMIGCEIMRNPSKSQDITSFHTLPYPTLPYPTLPYPTYHTIPYSLYVRLLHYRMNAFGDVGTPISTLSRLQILKILAVSTIESLLATNEDFPSLPECGRKAMHVI